MDDKNVCEGLSQMKMNNKRQNSRNGNESHHLLQQGVPYIIYCQGAADMNHSIKLCHGCYNLHFDDDDNDDDDDHDNIDHHDGLPAYSHHDKIPPWWEYIINRGGGFLSPAYSHH